MNKYNKSSTCEISEILNIIHFKSIKFNYVFYSLIFFNNALELVGFFI